MKLTDDPEKFAAYRERLARVWAAAEGRDPDAEYDEYHRNAVDDDGSLGKIVTRKVWQDYEDRAGNALCHIEDAGLMVVDATTPGASGA